MSSPRDPLELPLDGIRVVEASAGTGKTFTIATLYLRLILERGLAPEEIVVATFTRAAAAELSTRLRQRLVAADGLLSAGGGPRATGPDDNGDRIEARRIIGHAMAGGVAYEELQRRARNACHSIDTAMIGTLHGFCHRALGEFGFEAGQALREPELVEDVRALELEIVRDFWRRGSDDLETARCLAEHWGTPETLATQVADSRWRGCIVDPLAPRPDFGDLRRSLADARDAIKLWDGAALLRARDSVASAITHPGARDSRHRRLAAIRVEAKSRHDDNAFVKCVRPFVEEFSDRKLAKVGSFSGAFDGAELANVRELVAAIDALDAAEELLACHLLRDARAFLDVEMPRRLAARNQMGFDQAVDRLAAALEDPVRGAGLTTRIGARWKAALVDEFQDTDARQWTVVRGLFGAATLVLVGDPKQAIYGFRGGDVHAWLEACATADGEPLRLAESFRAGDGIANATNALFSHPGAFVDAGIQHPDVRAADTVKARALLHGGRTVPALQIWRLDPGNLESSKNGTITKGVARSAIEHACVAQIGAWLDPDAGFALRSGDGKTERVWPRNIAVLVNSNAEAQSMHAALGRAGIPAASELKASVLASDEASDIALLLGALAAPDDAPAGRAARASVLVGDDAAAIAKTVTDDAVHAALLEDTAGWAKRVQRHGPLAWLHRLIADAAPRLLALPDGERRVANYLQLAELVHGLAGQCFGLDDLAARYARACAEAGDESGAARLRLDTDADAVTVSTIHVAKGLEYDVVLVPYAVFGHKDAAPKRGSGIPLHWYHAGNVPHVALGSTANPGVTRKAAQEIAAENVRKLYVAVTRTSALCVLPWGPVNQMESSALYRLLCDATNGAGGGSKPSADVCGTALGRLCAQAGDAVQAVDLPREGTHRPARARNESPRLRARKFQRADLERDWRTWSFSRLVRGRGDANAGDTLPGAGDGDDPGAVDASPSSYAGPRFGTAVHAVFEQADFSAWRDAAGVPESERTLIERHLGMQGFPQPGSTLAHGVDLVAGCVHAALNAELPCGVRLCDVARPQRQAEIEFHLAWRPARSAALYALLHRHGYQSGRGGVEPDRLHGLLTGKIDLVFAHAGRFHVVDWKTNRCPPYDDAALAAEVAKHDYDLQWLLYTLALHRWLRQQVTGYAYDTHIGDVYYLFVRGMAAGHGVHKDRPPRGLIEAMDALFDANARAAA